MDWLDGLKEVGISPAPVQKRTVKRLSAAESSQMLSEETNDSEFKKPKSRAPAKRKLTTASQEPPAKRPVTTTAVARTGSTASMTASQIADLTPAGRAMMRMQKAEHHQYGKQHQLLLQLVQIGKMQEQYYINSVLADSAADLARLGAH